MKLPKVGEVAYAVQAPDDREGETTFLCSTQCNIERTAKKAIKEGIGVINDCREEEEQVTEKDLIVWEMRRIS
jgi:DNA-directed RNA polymerase subunit L